MENKVKVWGKEVNSCKECNYYNQEYDCNLIGMFLSEDIDISKDISKDCPFSKPITKEIIESFGGEVAYIPEAYKEDILFWFNNKKYLVHIHNHDRIIPLLIITDTEKCCNMDVFKGTINNPIELEFILKSIGVIE